MKKIALITLIVLSVTASHSSVMAGGCKLIYKLAPGQKWVCNTASKNETTFMGQKNVTQSKMIYDYTVSKGPKKGWVTMTARIKSKGPDNHGGMDLSKLRFTADVHTSGEIRNIQYTGSVMSDNGQNMDQMPSQMKKMMEDSYKMIPEAYKNAIFWFPEVPEDKLEVGDEFDVQREMGMGGSGSGMQMETVSKQVFTLEEVSKGLAYFSVKERSVTKTGGAMGGSSETKITGKGDAVFDLEQGMWLELTEKSKAKINLGGFAGMDKKDQDMNIILKYEMEEK
ncbi:hypothetical protein ACFL1Z_08130 [Thermodesulfobacteriota bacterium]